MDGIKATGIIVGSLIFGGLASCGLYQCVRRKKKSNGSYFRTKVGGGSNDEEDPAEDNAVISGVVSLPPVFSPSSHITRPKKEILPEEHENWERARYLFPGLDPDPRKADPRKPAELVVSELISQKYKELQQDKEEFDRLVKLENAVDLCLALGLNETVVRKRYEAIGNLERELSIKRKTPTIVSIQHLVKQIGVNNPFGNTGDINGTIMENYRNKDWLSYLGVSVERGKAAKSLSHVQEQLEEQNYEQCYMHGTTANALQKIFDERGFMFDSRIGGSGSGGKHDFGSGVYCFKADLHKPLSFAISRSWPMYDEDEGTFKDSNPAVVLFPKPTHLNKKEKQMYMCNVGEKRPFKDKDLKKRLGENEFRTYDNTRRSWGGQDKHWKEFVKLARYYNHVPPHQWIFCGALHDCSTVHRTDRCEEPRKDDQAWVQYCFTESYLLGRERLFIEFHVDWNKWIGNCRGDSKETRDEKVDNPVEGFERENAKWSKR